MQDAVCDRNQLDEFFGMFPEDAVRLGFVPKLVGVDAAFVASRYGTDIVLPLRGIYWLATVAIALIWVRR